MKNKSNNFNFIQESETEHQAVSKCICHKGFSGYSTVEAHINFLVGAQEPTPQSLAAHTLNRCNQLSEHPANYKN